MRRVPGRASVVPWRSNGRPDAWDSRCRTVEPSGPAGSSRSTTPSSAATSTARAVTSFVTDAQRCTRSVSPRVATTPSARTTPAAACGAGQSSIRRRASTARDAMRVERRLISSAMPWERTIGYSRAVRGGDHVHVSGPAPVMPDGADPPADPYDQARRCLAIILEALAEAGASAADVVRTRIYVTDAADIEAVGRAHGEVFGDIRPATTGVVVGLLDPRWLVEIEAVAIVTA